jgi:hypothetical protein
LRRAAGASLTRQSVESGTADEAFESRATATGAAETAPAAEKDAE